MIGNSNRYEVIVIGGGQAGLSVGYHLQRAGVRFLILDAQTRVGDVWRSRWDSLRLFTCARYSSLDGMPFPAAPDYFPTKDEMADYLEAYAAHFELPVLSGVRVERLSRSNGAYLLEAGARRFEAERVIVAMANHQCAKHPEFASELAPSIVQEHSIDYKSPAELAPGPVLIVGAGNSGAEIAKEVSRSHRVFVSGRGTGEIPFRIEGFLGRVVLVWLVLRVIFHRVLTVRNPIGRRVRPKVLAGGGPLIRVKAHDLRSLGVERVGRTVGAENGRPKLADGRVLDVSNVIWCTGFHAGFSWIDLDIFDDEGLPRHHAGIVPEAPGLYFVGLHFLYSLSSEMIHGVGRDAARVASRIAADRPSSLVRKHSDAA
jgi:putative flavoprotein involved in K+ transport